MPIHDRGIFRSMADSLAEDGGNDPVGRPLHQLAGKTTADAVAHVKELADAEVIHQPKLVVGECIPRVINRHGASGFAIVGVALVHGYAAEVVLEYLHSVEHRSGPVNDAGVQAPTRGYQEWKTRARFLVTDADVASLVDWQGSSSCVWQVYLVADGPSSIVDRSLQQTA